MDMKVVRGILLVHNINEMNSPIVVKQVKTFDSCQTKATS